MLHPWLLRTRRHLSGLPVSRTFRAVVPSLSGFGIPPLEAMTLGTPVFASHAGAMPWVLGQAAQYFDPHDMSDIARALTKASSLTCEENTRMVRAGRTRADHFSWAHSAQTLLDLLDVIQEYFQE